MFIFYKFEIFLTAIPEPLRSHFAKFVIKPRNQNIFPIFKMNPTSDLPLKQLSVGGRPETPPPFIL